MNHNATKTATVWLSVLVVLFFAASGCRSSPIPVAKCSSDPCVCLATPSEIVCESVASDGSDLKSVFGSKPKTTVESVTVTNVPNLKTLVDGVFGSVSAKSFVISNTGLETVADGAFKGSEDTAETVMFSGNRFIQFNFKSLKPIRKLANLDINNNERLAGSLPSDALDGHNYLGFLSLVNNSIAKLERNTFANLPLISSINLQGNQLTELGAGVLATGKARNLVTINLSSNKISKIDKDAFKDFKGRSLDLDDNQLTVMDQQVFEPLLNGFNSPDTFGILHVKGNAFKCDSATVGWLVQKTEQYRRSVRNFVCKENGKTLKELAKTPA